MPQDSLNYLVPNMYPSEMEVDPPDNNHTTGSFQTPVQSTSNISPASPITQNLLAALLNRYLPSPSTLATIVHSDSIPEPLEAYLIVVHRL
ncbi:unnamed protein product [Aspergillus oryzae]|uniref:Unnamed protein product n=2 Tax=Aspergillus oryzae TaxID=5062 RepID=A0AAN4Z002_ASPOZ|nr:unnamed protein product [Aspergillus oryzae]GMF89571.1 unnamed protein product [Aspergillus oryzae]GMG10081.1 unnamed protein product [Aspergillus oryzae]GMG38611.1 unnamed protein product [Aspergillus oryzae]GMG50252.1 unnamed protein product [Aspergillus oryzae var. brunneus]